MVVDFVPVRVLSGEICRSRFNFSQLRKSPGKIFVGKRENFRLRCFIAKKESLCPRWFFPQTNARKPEPSFLILHPRSFSTSLESVTWRTLQPLNAKPLSKYRQQIQTVCGSEILPIKALSKIYEMLLPGSRCMCLSVSLL